MITLTAIPLYPWLARCFENAILFIGLAGGGQLDVHLHAGFFFILVNTGRGNLPELAGVVGYERQLQTVGRIAGLDDFRFSRIAE